MKQQRMREMKRVERKELAGESDLASSMVVG
jgi:hypothetical protein